MKARCLYLWFHVLNQTGAAYCHAGTGVLISVQLLTSTISSQVITAALCTLRLAWSHFTDALQMSLVRVCGSYLWPASLSKEPAVRRELEGFIHMGSGGFCTSVLTSGSISEGEGVSFAPAMVLLLPARPWIAFFPPVGVGTGGLAHRPTAAETNASFPSRWCCAEAGGRGASLLPCSITGARQTSGPGVAQSSIPDWGIVDPCVSEGPRVVTITRRPLHQPDLQWDYIIVVRSSAFSSIDQKTVKYFEMINRSRTVHLTFS